jgi:AcrR family transcriptional regulator
MSATSCSALGRPRAFDPEEALEKALEVFWQKGYEGTSLTDLTKAMEINKPSLYSTFGNKEELFLKAIDLYSKRPCGFFTPALERPTAAEVMTSLLKGAALSLADTSNPQGCVLVQGALACSEQNSSIKTALIRRRLEGEDALKARFERALAEGDKSVSHPPEVLARYLMTLLNGMTIQSTNGASAKQLMEIAEFSLSLLPSQD